MPFVQIAQSGVRHRWQQENHSATSADPGLLPPFLILLCYNLEAGGGNYTSTVCYVA